MPHVMCRGNWEGTFHRTINGERKAFPPGKPVELNDAEVKAVKDDLGKALLPVEIDEKGRPRVLDLAEIELSQADGDHAEPKAESTEPQADGDHAEHPRRRNRRG